MLSEITYRNYIKILEEELVPAMGCTEPIAIALAAAKARDTLGETPVHLLVNCSPNVVKNARSVTVPNSGGLHGIEASAALGYFGGDASVGLQVLSQVQPEAILLAKRFVDKGLCEVALLETDANLHIIVEAKSLNHWVSVEIKDAHDNICCIKQDGEVIFKPGTNPEQYYGILTDRTCLNVADILAFSNQCDLKDINTLIKAQIEYNMAIAHEGLNHVYGVGIGNSILRHSGNDTMTKMKAYAAAASEARMSGCALPVITNSGSGNQGITASVPLIVYADAQGISEEKLYRALVFSNLLTIHQKTCIGRLSAFCGAVCAACAVGAALTYLDGGDLLSIRNTMVNMYASVVGMICDGAKPSCAAKIVSSLDAAILGYHLASDHQVYEAESGILKVGIEENIRSVCQIASKGMKETDAEILRIMLGC